MPPLTVPHTTATFAYGLEKFAFHLPWMPHQYSTCSGLSVQSFSPAVTEGFLPLGSSGITASPRLT